VKNDYVQTAVSRQADLDPVSVQKLYDDLQARAAAALDREGFPRAQHQFVRSADLRYFGQAFEVRVPVAPEPLDRLLADSVADAFHATHEQLYGYSFRGDDRQPVEWVNLRVSGIGPIPRPQLRQVAAGDGDPGGAQTGVRPVFFDDWVETPVFWRPDLASGDAINGPAVVEEFGSTVPLHPGFTAQVDRLGNLIVTKELRL
jgi:N-methylhydantoinase A